MPYTFKQEWRLCQLEPKSWVYRLLGTFPKTSPMPAYAILEDSEGNEVRHDAEIDEDLTPAVDDFDVSVPVDLPAGEHTITLTLHVPDETSAAAGNVRFRMTGNPVRSFEPGNYYPSGCFSTAAPPQETVQTLEVTNRDSALTVARIIRDIGVSMPDALARASRLMEPGDQIRSMAIDHRPGSGVIVINAFTRAVAFLYGTTTNAQLSQQAGEMAGGPVDFGRYGTLNIWRDGVQFVKDLMRDAGVGVATPVLLCGYSMGGAIAFNHAVELMLGRPQRSIELLTFGCPRPGDDRFIYYTSGMRQRHIKNAGDVIPWCCPTPVELGPLALGVPGNTLNAIAKWRSPRSGAFLFGDGTMLEGDGPPAQVADLGAAWAAMRVFDAIPSIATHDMAEYVRRLEMR